MFPVAFDLSGVDPDFKGHAQRGIGRYVSELKNYFDLHVDPEIAISYFNHKDLLSGGVSGAVVNALPVGRTTVRQQLLYPFRLQAGPLKNIELVHFAAHMDAPAWSRKPYVLTVLDLIPLVLKELYKANRSGPRFHFARWLEITSIRHASHLIAISEHTANDIVNVLGIPRERISVTPLGVDTKFFEIAERRRRKLQGDSEVISHGQVLRRELNLPDRRPLVLYVGGHDERKNIDRLMAIVRGLIQELSRKGGTTDAPFLVLAGRIGSQAEMDRYNAAIKKYGMEVDCSSLGYVPDGQLRALYCESEIFLFPSLYEGFGLPPLEAMAAGLPVVSSSSSSMPEVIGEAGVLFNPESVEEGVTAALSVFINKEFAAKLSLSGESRARQFTWERTGQMTLEAYKRAAQVIRPRVARGDVLPLVHNG